MRQAYEKLYTVENHGFNNTIYCRKFAFTRFCASSIPEVECDQKSFSVVDEHFRLKEAGVAFKNYRKHHCASFENTIIMSLIHFDAVITEAFDSFKSQTDMQNMCPMEIMRDHKSGVQRRLRLHRKWSS